MPITKRVTVIFPIEDYERQKKFAARAGKSVPACIREAVLRYIDAEGQKEKIKAK